MGAATHRLARFSVWLLAVVASLVAVGLGEVPQKITVCDLKNDPVAYNHKLVQLEGFVAHDFEDFTVFDPDCPYAPEIWLEYGGTAASGTMYCCGMAANRTRPQELVVEGVPIPLTDDEHFREFDRLIHPPFRSGNHGSVVHATLVGRFFLGQKQSFGSGGWGWGGYGHMGCCTLLAIQTVLSVDPQEQTGLDYGVSADQPDTEKSHCPYEDLLPIQPFRQVIEAQQNAESGERTWAFTDPERVASDALAGLLKRDRATITGMRESHRAEGRLAYMWMPEKTGPQYMVVVSRPYWLSFYASDPRKVAWIAIAAYKICGD